MVEELTRWANKIKERRRRKEEAPYILAEYFNGGFIFDEEVAGGLDITIDELKKLRSDYDR
ncbi:MAG: hypothetical protein WAO23_03880 [Dethiobacteria bacterium]